MASFDPSIISQIPDMAGNPMEARAKAYKLADLITNEQRSKLLLGQQKQETDEQQKRKDILQGYKGDISTTEGQFGLAKEYQKAGLPKDFKEALQIGSESSVRDLKKKEEEIRILDLYQNQVGPAALQVKDTLTKQGLPAAQAQYAQLLPTMPQELRAKWPPQLPNDPQQAAQLLDGAISVSEKASKIVQQHLAERKEALAERKQDTSESEAAKRDVREDRRLSMAENKAGAAAGTAGGFADPKVQALEASIASTGFSLPAGFRAKEQQLSLYQGLLRKYDGLDPDDIAKLLASNAIDYKGVSKATQTAAGIAGKVEFANNELTQFVPIARDASAAVDRTSFVPYNKLAQLGKSNISDPDQKRLFVATQTILNAYDLLAARGGTDKDKRAENRKILETADGPEAYNAALDFILKEGEAAGKAAGKATKASAYGGIPGGKSDTSAGGGMKPYSDPEKERRYQEWKKAHPNG